MEQTRTNAALIALLSALCGGVGCLDEGPGSVLDGESLSVGRLSRTTVDLSRCSGTDCAPPGSEVTALIGAEQSCELGEPESTFAQWEVRETLHAELPECGGSCAISSPQLAAAPDGTIWVAMQARRASGEVALDNLSWRLLLAHHDATGRLLGTAIVDAEDESIHPDYSYELAVAGNGHVWIWVIKGIVDREGMVVVAKEQWLAEFDPEGVQIGKRVPVERTSPDDLAYTVLPRLANAGRNRLALGRSTQAPMQPGPIGLFDTESRQLEWSQTRESLPTEFDLTADDHGELSAVQWNPDPDDAWDVVEHYDSAGRLQWRGSLSREGVAERALARDAEGNLLYAAIQYPESSPGSVPRSDGEALLIRRIDRTGAIVQAIRSSLPDRGQPPGGFLVSPRITVDGRGNLFVPIGVHNGENYLLLGSYFYKFDVLAKTCHIFEFHQPPQIERLVATQQGVLFFTTDSTYGQIWGLDVGAAQE
jgi:hypothetical protein